MRILATGETTLRRFTYRKEPYHAGEYQVLSMPCGPAVRPLQLHDVIDQLDDSRRPGASPFHGDATSGRFLEADGSFSLAATRGVIVCRV